MNEKDKTKTDDIIDISLVLTILKKYLIILIIGTLVGGIGTYYYSKYFIPKTYKAVATVIVNNVSPDVQYLYTSELNTSRSLAQLYTVVIKSDTVLQQVIDELDLHMSLEQLKNSVSIRAIENTQVVELSVTSSNPEYAVSVTEKFVEVSKIMISEKFENGSVKDLNVTYLVNNGAPIAPNNKQNATKGAAVGFGLVAVIVFLKEFLDTKIRTEADAVAALDVPVLGVIPLIDRKEFHK